MWVARVCSKNINVFDNTLTTTVNEFVINAFIKYLIRFTIISI